MLCFPDVLNREKLKNESNGIAGMAHTEAAAETSLYAGMLIMAVED